MSLFKNLTTDGVEKSEDRLGGFSILDSDIYETTIKAMYAGESQKGAMSVTLIGDVGGREYRETIYITSSKSKGQKNYYERDGKKMPLPGFTVIDDICLIATGKPLADQDTEEKVVNIYDFDQKKEVPTTVPMLVEALGQKVALGIQKQLENKNVQNASGEYEATEETREINVVDKVFHPELNKGEVRDRREIKEGQGGASGRPAKAAPKAGSAPAPTKSLFGKK